MDSNVIYFNLTNSITKEGLFDWVCGRLSDRNEDKLNVIRSYHALEIQQIVDYLIDLYGGTFVQPFVVTSALLTAMKEFGFTKEYLTSETLSTVKVNTLLK